MCQNDEKQKALFLQLNRCGGCHICIEVCPKKCLDKSDELNTKVQYPPKFKEGVECSFCQSCELVCPDFAIYVVPVEELVQK
ncbi:MAG: 4Fe-4S dicluster domain-containing protein [Candidatus Helarchaeota archaeon]|nr:4Fe-4S dicluster domain-containing protein [Candidatus Helarchaeota archaeon]